MTREPLRRSTPRTVILCDPCWNFECEDCVGLIEENGLKVRCPCAVAGHEVYWDDSDEQPTVR
jgi:hypothetical protein